MTECLECEWQSKAIETQNRFCDLLGGEYDSSGENNEFYIKKKIGFSIFGTPSELPTKENCFIGYKTDQRESINEICKKIVEVGFNRRNNTIKMDVLFVVWRLENKYNVEEPVYRIAIDGGKICFVDTHTRVYTDWDHYLSTNELPRCQMCYPENGLYTSVNNCVLVSFGNSPSCNLSCRILSGLDTAGMVVSVAAIATSFVAAAPMAVAAGAAATIGTGVYATVRSIGTLFDRHEHGESLELTNKQARSQYLYILASTAGCVAGGVTHVTQKALANGQTVGKAGMMITKGLNWSSAAVSAVSILDNSYTMLYSKDELTTQDFFNLSCEVMFFAAACHSISNTNNFLSDLNSTNISAQENTILRKTKLTKTQKRNLQKRNAKARKRGELVGQSNELNGPSVGNTTSKARWDFMLKCASVCPRTESILNKGNNICHDYYQMREGKISLIRFVYNTTITLNELYKEYKDDVKHGVELLLKLFKHCKKVFFEEAASDEFFSYTLCENVIEVQGAIDSCYDLVDTNSGDDICKTDWILTHLCDLTMQLISIHFRDSSKNTFSICLHAVCTEIVKEVKIRIEKFQQKQSAYCVNEDIGKFMFNAAVRAIDLASLITPEIAALKNTGVRLWESVKNENISWYLHKSDKRPDDMTYLKWMSDIIVSSYCPTLISDIIGNLYNLKFHCKIEVDINKVSIIIPSEVLGLNIEAFIFRTSEGNPSITLVTTIKRN